MGTRLTLMWLLWTFSVLTNKQRCESDIFFGKLSCISSEADRFTATPQIRCPDVAAHRGIRPPSPQPPSSTCLTSFYSHSYLFYLLHDWCCFPWPPCSVRSWPWGLWIIRLLHSARSAVPIQFKRSNNAKSSWCVCVCAGVHRICI